MPEYQKKEVSLAFDLCGCPNRRRHCRLGRASRTRMSLSEAIEAFARAREHVQSGAEMPHLERVKYFGGHIREPHYCPDYKELYEKEMELNQGEAYAATCELLSIWRLARDPDYGRWAREIGTRRCRISLCGLDAANDWFYRRKGAHGDIITATLRLIENGIQPRWQVFHTRRGVPDLPGVLRLIDDLRVRERLSAMGLQFELFVNDPTPIGEARRLEHERLTRDDVMLIPRELILATEQLTGKPFRCRTEAEWISGILSREDRPIGLDYPGVLWFFVTPDWSVYPNIGSLESWWRLARCQGRDLSGVFSLFFHDGARALRAGRELMLHEAARAYGDPRGDRVYMAEADLHGLWLERYREGHRDRSAHRQDGRDRLRASTSPRRVSAGGRHTKHRRHDDDRSLPAADRRAAGSSPALTFTTTLGIYIALTAANRLLIYAQEYPQRLLAVGKLFFTGFALLVFVVEVAVIVRQAGLIRAGASTVGTLAALVLFVRTVFAPISGFSFTYVRYRMSAVPWSENGPRPGEAGSRRGDGRRGTPQPGSAGVPLWLSGSCLTGCIGHGWDRQREPAPRSRCVRGRAGARPQGHEASSRGVDAEPWPRYPPSASEASSFRPGNASGSRLPGHCSRGRRT